MTIKAELSNDQIVLEAQWSDKELIKKIPGASWDNTQKQWTLPCTFTACLQLRGVFGPRLEVGAALRGWATSAKARHARLTELREAQDAPGNSDLYPFQRAGVDFLRMAKTALLGDEQGCGKTIQILQELMLPALVVCPNSVKRNWAQEAQRWSPLAVPYVVTGSAAQRRKLLDLAQDDSKALVIINFESVRLHSRTAGFGSIALKRCNNCGGSATEAACETHARELNAIPFRTVVVDEAHRMKDANSKQTRAIWGAAKGSLQRYALTGTPIADNAADLWPILHFIAPKDFPRKSAFVDRYCVTSFNAWGGMDIAGLNPATKDEFQAIFHPFYRYMSKKRVLSQLPVKVREKRYIQLTPSQKKSYAEMADGLITRLEDGELLIAANQLVAQTRLIQFSSATMRSNDDGSYTMCEPSPKIDVLVEILEDHPGSIVVCAESRQLIELAAARLDKLKIPYGIITGAVSQDVRTAMLEDFQAGYTRVLLFTIKAGGVGLTMTAADTIVFLQRSWSMIDNMQAEDRVHRIGSEQHSSITIIDLVAEGTVEEHQISSLWVKADRLAEVRAS